MNEAELSVHILLDNSGSMDESRHQVVKAYNALIEQLQFVAMPPNVTMSTFNYSLTTFYENRPVYKVPKMTLDEFYTSGGTSLWSCILHSLSMMGATKAKRKVMVLVTDGGENARGPEFDAAKAAVRKMEKDGWLLIYLYLENDEYAERAVAGLQPPKGTTMAFDRGTIPKAVTMAADAIFRFQSSKGNAKEAAFTDEERKRK